MRCRLAALISGRLLLKMLQRLVNVAHRLRFLSGSPYPDCFYPVSDSVTLPRVYGCPHISVLFRLLEQLSTLTSSTQSHGRDLLSSNARIYCVIHLSGVDHNIATKRFFLEMCV